MNPRYFISTHLKLQLDSIKDYSLLEDSSLLQGMHKCRFIYILLDLGIETAFTTAVTNTHNILLSEALYGQ